MSALKFIVLAALLIPSFLLAQLPDVHDYIYVDKEPIVLNLPDVRQAIGYPADALKKGIEGKVYCRVLVNEAGEYLQHRILNATHPILALAVDPYLSRLKFLPAKKGKRNVSYWTNIPIAFNHKDSKFYIGNSGKPTSFGTSYSKKAAYRIEQANELLAIQEYQASILDFTRALMYIPVARKKPSKAASKLFGIYLGRAKAYIGNLQYERAVLDLIQAIGLGHTASDKSSVSDLQIAEAYNLRAYCRLILQNPVKANQDINWVLFHYAYDGPAYYQAQAQQAAVHRQLMQYEKALSAAEDAIERSPKEAYAYYEKGLTLWTIGAKEAAIQCFDQAKARNLSEREQERIDRLLARSENLVLEH